jgi:hypothetical protein
VVLKEESGDIREMERVVNQKTQVPRVKEVKETRRDFGFPKNHFFRLHAYVSMVKLPENDESGFRFWVGGTQETRRDPERFWAPEKPFF